MPWFKSSLKNSIHAIFSASTSVAPEDGEPEVGIEDIRESMLALISGIAGERFAHVTRRIRYASDVQALWFLRGDLMAVLSSSHGEAAALERVEAVTEMFEDMLPRGLRSRPSPLRSINRD